MCVEALPKVLSPLFSRGAPLFREVHILGCFAFRIRLLSSRARLLSQQWDGYTKSLRSLVLFAGSGDDEPFFLSSIIVTGRTRPVLLPPWGLVQSGRSASLPHKRSSGGLAASESKHGEATDFAFVALTFHFRCTDLLDADAELWWPACESLAV